MGQSIIPQVVLDFDADEPSPVGYRTMACRGFSASYVSIGGPSEFSYRWVGFQHYLALHDLKRLDGETTVDGAAPVRVLDLRGLMTFVPKGCAIGGWSAISRRTNGFIALYYDPDIVREELDGRSRGDEAQPMLYFTDAALRWTLAKIQALLLNPSPADAVYAETLGVLAAIEVDRLQRMGTGPGVRESGRLSPRQEKLVRSYIAENLHRKISLNDLAAVVQLSRFHFTRAFKNTIGVPPHQFVLRSRIDRAKAFLLDDEISIQQIAQGTGFGGASQFSEAFKRMTGYSPSQFGRLHR